MQNRWHAITRRWLARLSFSFLILAFFLAWEGYKRFKAAGGSADGKTTLDFVAAAMSAVLAFTGLRERHRPEE